MKYQDLEELVTFGIALAKAIDDSGKGLLVEGKDVLQLVKTAPPAFKDADKAWDEYLGLDDGERTKLKSMVETAHPFVDKPNVENAIELVFGILCDMSELVKFFVPAPAAPAAAPQGA